MWLRRLPSGRYERPGNQEGRVRLGDPVQSLILDLLEWIAPRPRPYSEVIEVWRTSCPRLPVWEEVTERAFVELRSQESGPLLVYLTSRGREFLDRHRGIEHARTEQG
jgi:hypothetical protein